MRAGKLSFIAATSTVAIVASLAAAPTAQAAASIYNSGSQCIGATPAGWTSAPVLPGDRAIVWSPPALHAEAVDIAHEVRAKAIIAGYESKLSIAAIGFPGQPGPFPIYVDPNFHTASPGAEGIFARRCLTPSTSAIVMDTTVEANLDDRHDTVAHELFHAAQAGVVGGPISGNWWYEATATWAAARLGYKASLGFSHYVTDHPEQPMDAFVGVAEGSSSHQYGAWTFVAWLYSRGLLGYPGLKQSLHDVNNVNPPTPVLATQIGPATFASAVASYWGDHTRDVPKFGPRAKITILPVAANTHTLSVPTAAQYGARVIGVRAPTKTGIMQFHIRPLGPGLEAYVNVGHGALEHLVSGQGYSETFCFGGAKPGTAGMPKGGEVRVAITTVGTSAPTPVKIDTTVSAQQCPQNLVVVPGLAIGALHIGMTRSQARAASHETSYVGHSSVLCPTCAWGYYKPITGRSVTAVYAHGRIATLWAYGQQGFITTGGITLTDLASTLAPGAQFPDPVGSPEKELQGAHPSTCKALDHEKHPALQCQHNGPAGRYTITQLAWISCVKNDTNLCYYQGDDEPVGPEPGYYVVNIIVTRSVLWTYPR